MNKKKNRAEFAASLDRRLSGLQGDPWLAQRIIASEKGDFKVKKISRTMIIVAALIVLTMATALAAGLGGRVNWLGDTKTRSELEPSATPMPMPVPETSKSADGIDPSYYDLLDYSKDREQIVISTENGGASSARIQTIKSIDEFNTLVNTGSGLPLPEKMPDGYVFEKGFAELGCLPEGHYVLTSETIHPEGFTETHYTVDPSMDFVRAYTLIFRKQSDNGDHADHVQVNVQMTTYKERLSHSTTSLSDTKYNMRCLFHYSMSSTKPKAKTVLTANFEFKIQILSFALTFTVFMCIMLNVKRGVFYGVRRNVFQRAF